MKETFENELQSTLKQCAKWSRRNYTYAHVVFFLSILGSFAASVLAAAEYQAKDITAALAALPGLVLIINTTLRFEERTKWFWLVSVTTNKT